MKGLPTGMQYFKEIIENNYLYVDKTEFIHKIANTGKFYFLSRPRRFGKSLLVSTLEELFKGNKELFEDLYIYDKWNWENSYPIIKVDFSEISHDSSSNLKLSLIKFLKDTATNENIELEDIDLLPDKFSELIKKLHDKTGNQVVVLIDEYDKPIIKHLDDIDLAKSNRDVLSSFYQVLKGNDKHLRFVFLTGVGSPTFLVNMIMNNPNNIHRFLNPETKFVGSFPSFDFEKIDLNTILLQTGYLTIKNKKAVLGKLPEYFLDIPNKEVHDSFYSHLISYFTCRSPGSIQPMAEDMLNYIIDGDEKNLIKSFEILLNNIPSILHQRIENINEAYYHLLFTSWLQILGFEVSNEDRSLSGDADTILRMNNLIIIIEYKYSQKLSLETMLNNGIKQIKNKCYHKAYQNKKLIFVSIATQPKKVTCKIEKYN
jgi:hypothetical protein